LVGIARFNSGYRTDICLGIVILHSGGSISRIQSFEAYIEAFRLACIRCLYRRFNHNPAFNHFIINILILTIMSKVFLLGAEPDKW
jgi:hypothetical protein